MKKISKRAVWLFFFREIKIIFAALISIAAVGSLIYYRAETEGIVPLNLVLIIVVPIFVIILLYFLAIVRRFAYKYDFNDGYFEIEKGILNKKHVSIPYQEIENIDIHRNIFARIFGLSELRIQTAGYSDGESREVEGYLPGLDEKIAWSIRTELINRKKIIHKITLNNPNNNITNITSVSDDFNGSYKK